MLWHVALGSPVFPLTIHGLQAQFVARAVAGPQSIAVTHNQVTTTCLASFSLFIWFFLCFLFLGF